MYRIGTITGEARGAGEAIDTAFEVVRAMGIRMERIEFDLGARRYLRTGELLPREEVARLRGMHALLCGSPPGGNTTEIPPGVLERGILFGLRRELDLTVNLRVFRGLGDRARVDIAVVRENSEGLYSGEGSVLHSGSDVEVTTEVSVATHHATRRCVQYAFELARSRRNQVTLAHKRAVLTASGALWVRAARTLAAQYPEVNLRVENVDALCARLVIEPERYDVIVTDNLFGDIVADVAGAATGSLGRSGSAELTSALGGPSLFEPVHAAHEAGQNVDPLGAITAAAMMLGDLGESAASGALRQATLVVASDQPPRTQLADTVTATARELLASTQGRQARTATAGTAPANQRLPRPARPHTENTVPDAENGHQDHVKRIVMAPPES